MGAFRAWGRYRRARLWATLEEAFEQSALALAAVVTEAPVTPKIAVTVVCEAPDNELLLV